jgi:hypothetical protein
MQVNSQLNIVESNKKSSSWLASPSEMVKSAIKIAPLAIAVFAASSFEPVDAGFLLEVCCIASCHAFVAINPPLGLAWYSTCMNICILTGVAPTP